ncbi:MAG: hypothetical protein D6714_03300 [Bacteroidetes bacterium]|nr:MAG: hypothetical protein D6714_03300 [Bacteroidota bacterium]
MESLTFQYPTWYLFFCALLGLVYALILYYRDTTFKEASPRLNLGLGILRFLAVTLIAILLLSPLLKSILTETKKPVVVLAQDESESVAAEMDSVALNTYRKAFEQLRDRLSEQYEVVTYAFGEKVRPGIDFKMTDKATNIASVLTEVYDLYGNQNLGAVVLATDGIYNQGTNPLYVRSKLNAPVYAVALGDTIPKKDLILKRVFHNKIAYLGDKFTIQVDIAGINCAGHSSVLSVSKIENGKSRKLEESPVKVGSDDFFTTKELVLNADKTGVQRYRIALSQVPGEAITANNYKDIFVDVLDARQKILIVANAPHPDISALKQIIEKNKNYEVRLTYANDFKANLAETDFVIFHQVPSRENDLSAIFTEINNRKIPRLFIVGAQTSYDQFNQVQGLLTIKSDQQSMNDVQAVFAPNFNLFTIDEDLRDNLPKFPPLTAPFGEFDLSPGAQPLLFQRIGSIETTYPLLIFGEENGIKTAILSAEGLWKWRLFNYLQNQNHDLVETLISKTIQYTSLKADKRRFRVNLDKNIFNENEPITFGAELYNESYELINEPDVSLTITDDGGREFKFTFDKTADAYSLNAGIFPVGNYHFLGTTFFNGQKLEYAGQFSVQPVQLEVYETTADHALLRLLSKQFGGQVFYPNQLDALSDELTNRNLKPVVYSTTKTRSVIHLKWIFFLLTALLALEWFLRRYHGGY